MTAGRRRQSSPSAEKPSPRVRLQHVAERKTRTGRENKTIHRIRLAPTIRWMYTMYHSYALSVAMNTSRNRRRFVSADDFFEVAIVEIEEAANCSYFKRSNVMNAIATEDHSAVTDLEYLCNIMARQAACEMVRGSLIRMFLKRLLHVMHTLFPNDQTTFGWMQRAESFGVEWVTLRSFDFHESFDKILRQMLDAWLLYEESNSATTPTPTTTPTTTTTPPTTATTTS